MNQPSKTAAKIGIGPEWWASQIAVCFAKSARAVIETGRTLNEAEAALSRADFAGLIGRPGTRGRLPFSYETARRLMAVGRDERLSRLLAHGPNLLPASWRTLFELTKLTDEQFALALEQNLICADMERYVVDHIRQGVYSPKSSEPPTSAPEPVILHTKITHSVRRLDDPVLRTWRHEITPPADKVLPLDPAHTRRAINHLESLKMAWDAASETDRVEFLDYIGARRIN